MSNYKHVKIALKVRVEIVNPPRDYSHADWVEKLVEENPAIFQSSVAAMHQGGRIIAAFKHAEASDPEPGYERAAKLLELDHKALARAADKPEDGYPTPLRDPFTGKRIPLPTAVTLEFAEAITKHATSEPPKVPEAVPEEAPLAEAAAE